jgi:hypothetical protein
MSRRIALLFAFPLLLLTPRDGVAAQRQPAREQPVREQPAAAAPAPVTPVPQQSARETREELERVLEQYGPALPRVLKLDPSLLTNDAYLQPYPALKQFLAQHPEVARNANYFLAEYNTGVWGEEVRRLPQDRAYEMWNSVLQGFMIVFFFSAIFGGLVWVIKTAIEHRRWTRLSKIQTEVHNKLLDRFSANEELLAYIQTPAGKRFLESAPIPLDNPRSVSAPLGRILWSAQIGAVLTIAGIGIEVVAANAMEDVAQPVTAIGIFVIAIGVGFLVSAVLAYMISRRMGLLAQTEAPVDSRG